MIEDGRYEPTEATLDLKVGGENEAEILEGLHDPISTSMRTARSTCRWR